MIRKCSKCGEHGITGVHQCPAESDVIDITIDGKKVPTAPEKKEMKIAACPECGDPVSDISPPPCPEAPFWSHPLYVNPNGSEHICPDSKVGMSEIVDKHFIPKTEAASRAYSLAKIANDYCAAAEAKMDLGISEHEKLAEKKEVMDEMKEWFDKQTDHFLKRWADANKSYFDYPGKIMEKTPSTTYPPTVPSEADLKATPVDTEADKLRRHQELCDDVTKKLLAKKKEVAPPEASFAGHRYPMRPIPEPEKDPMPHYPYDPEISEKLESIVGELRVIKALLREKL